MKDIGEEIKRILFNLEQGDYPSIKKDIANLLKLVDGLAIKSRSTDTKEAQTAIAHLEHIINGYPDKAYFDFHPVYKSLDILRDLVKSDGTHPEIAQAALDTIINTTSHQNLHCANVKTLRELTDPSVKEEYRKKAFDGLVKIAGNNLRPYHQDEALQVLGAKATSDELTYNTLAREQLMEMSKTNPKAFNTLFFLAAQDIRLAKELMEISDSKENYFNKQISDELYKPFSQRTIFLPSFSSALEEIALNPQVDKVTSDIAIKHLGEISREYEGGINALVVLAGNSNASISKPAVKELATTLVSAIINTDQRKIWNLVSTISGIAPEKLNEVGLNQTVRDNLKEISNNLYKRKNVTSEGYKKVLSVIDNISDFMHDKFGIGKGSLFTQVSEMAKKIEKGINPLSTVKQVTENINPFHRMAKALGAPLASVLSQNPGKAQTNHSPNKVQLSGAKGRK